MELKDFFETAPLLKVQQKPLPDTVALFELEGALLLPRAHLPIHVQEPKYKALIEKVLGHNRFVGFVQPRYNNQNDLFDTGCLGQVSTFVDRGDGTYFIIIKGIVRFQVQKVINNKSLYRSAQVEYERYLLDLSDTTETIEGRDHLITLLKDFLKYNDLLGNWDEIAETSDENLISLLAMICPFEPLEKQAILESHTLKDRSRMIASLMEMTTLMELSKTWRTH